VCSHLEVVEEERLERGVDRHDPMPAALRLADVEQMPFEVDVLPVECEQLAAAQAGVGEEREQGLVALALAREVALPDVVALDRLQQAGDLAPVERASGLLGSRFPISAVCWPEGQL
jgi:hypothetical protein